MCILQLFTVQVKTSHLLTCFHIFYILKVSLYFHLDFLTCLLNTNSVYIVFNLLLNPIH